jgi:predicted phage tail protein
MTIPAFDENTRLTDPAVTDDVLASKQFQTLVELLGEGEIEGFPSAAGLTQGTTAYNNAALKDVFLNGTQVLQSTASNTTPADTDFNFPNVSFEPRFGTSNQTAIQGISEIETENAVGVAVTKASPVSRSITNTSVNAVRVTLGFPSLQKFEDDGDINGAEVAINIQTIENDGTTTTVITDTVKGRTASTYFRDYKINFASGTSFPVTIRVNRTTDDSTETTLQNSSIWSSFTEIINEQRAYANSAHVAIRFDAQTFPSIPKRMYKVRGTKIKIPHNGTVQSDGSISYSGTFNGTFKTDKEWTNDPAWILYDLLTTSKGFGDQIDTTQLDVFSFYSASVYSAEQVDDGSGTGSTEPRFSCNVVIQNQKQAYNLINDLCSVMRVMPFYSAGTISITQDRPTDPSYLFNLSNITEQGFSYSNSAKNSKITVVNVAYFDNETQQIEYETVEDTALQTKYGVVTKNLRGFATTSRGMASRLGKWFLYTQSNEAEIVNFTTTLESGTLVRPGAVINVADPLRAGVRRGGRIKTGVSTTQIVVDDENNTDLATTGSATLSVILADGTLETKTIDAISGTTITVSSAFSSTPPSNSVWVIENTTVQLQTFRVIGVTEVDQLAYQITAVAHNSSKYANVEDGTALATRTITTLTELKPSPSNLQGSEQIVVLNNRAVSKLFIQWQPVAGVTEYMVQYRFQNENFISERITRPDFTIFETKNGTYEIRVFSYNALGKPSITPTTTSFTTVGKTARPADVQNLRIEPISDQFVRLRFDKSTDVDVVHGGNVVVRSSNLTDGTGTFTNAVDVIPALPGSINETIVPNIVEGEYILKFRDDGGRLSEGETSVLVTSPDPLPKLTVFTDREDTDSPPFAGAKVDCFFSDDVNGLVLGSLVTLDDESDFDAIADFDFIGAVDITGGSYEFANTLDLGGKQPLRLRRHFVTQGFYPNDLIDRRTANIDTWTDFDAATAFSVGASLLVATTDLDPDLVVSSGVSYGQSGTTITVTKTAHGYSVGDFVVIDFAAGGATDGNYQITSKTDNTFTVTSATSATISSGTTCTYGANFSQFNPFVNGTYVARGFKFRCEMDSDDPAQSIEIDQLGYTAELESRTETSLTNAGASAGGFIASGTSTKSVTFTNSFFTGQSGTSIAANSVLPSVGITIENAQSGDFFALSNITGSGFDIDVKNGSSHVNRNFKYAATGFGRGS